MAAPRHWTNLASRGLAALVAAFISTRVIAETAAPELAGFRVFDALTYKGKPDLSYVGLKKIYIIDRNPDNSTPPNEAGVRQVVANVSTRDPAPIIVFDIEGFDHPTDIRRDPKTAIDAELAYLENLIIWAKDVNKRAKVGFFAIMPKTDYWTPNLFDAVKNNPGDPRWHHKGDSIRLHMRNLLAANRYVASLAEKVDFIFPELYTPFASYRGDPFGVNYHGWEQFADFMIAEARKYRKPVYPFIFHQITEGALPVYRFRLPPFDPAIGPFKGWRHMSFSCPDGLWSKEIAFLRAHADGVVLWGTGSYLNENWDDISDWWAETVKSLSNNCDG
jgi:hypothetical protein